MNMTFKDTWCTQRDLNKSERLRWDQHKTSWVTFPKVKDQIIRQPPTRSFETVAQPDRSCLPLAFSEDRLPWLPAVQKSWRQWTWMGTHNAPLNKRDLMFIFWECMFLASLSKILLHSLIIGGRHPKSYGMALTAAATPQNTVSKRCIYQTFGWGGTHRAHVSINRGSNVDIRGQKMLREHFLACWL